MAWERDFVQWPFNIRNSQSEHWALTLITPPATEPITVVEAKAHLRVDFPDDDNYITALISAARFITEERTNRALITQDWDYVLDGFPGSDIITLRKPTLQSVTSIKYKDTTGFERTMDPSDYIVDKDSVPGRIVLAFGRFWPFALLQPASAVRIRFTAGYGDASKVPQPIKQAMLFLISQWYENREPINLNARYAVTVPMTFDYLIGPYKVWRFQ